MPQYSNDATILRGVHEKGRTYFRNQNRERPTKKRGAILIRSKNTRRVRLFDKIIMFVRLHTASAGTEKYQHMGGRSTYKLLCGRVARAPRTHPFSEYVANEGPGEDEGAS